MFDRGEVIRKVILNGVRWTGLSRLYRAMNPCAGAILMLHRVTADETSPLGYHRHLSITPCFLDDLLTGLAADGYRFVSMDEMARRLSGGDRAAGDDCVIAITADDGYRDNMTEALPVLERHGAPITIYAAPAQIDRRVTLWWNVLEEVIARREGFYLPTPDGTALIDCASLAAKRRAYEQVERYLTEDVPEEKQDALVRELAATAGFDPDAPGRSLLMDWDELRTISRHELVTIGAHTIHHYNLKRLDADKAYEEMATAADVIELELGRRPLHMAFPYGYEAAAGAREVELAAKAGFLTATTTRHGLLTGGHQEHMHALPRISVNGRYQSVNHLRTMLSGITTPIANGGKRLVTV
ncbi:MAG: polysaccharide deacetylase family protein [Notoacmeibacter sp.]|nr:polysaccharide deacetylase family protein [Notoacmeibacter sp.]MCC0031898.1 polysaccharide deacetylase family protein [Brucellaceae bacterium]